MIISFKVLSAIVAVLSILIAMVGRSDTPPPATSAVDQYELDDQLPLKKADRLPPIVAIAPVPEPIVMAQAQVAAARSDVPQTVGTTVSVRRHLVKVEQNICTKHGMRKVITRGGKSWRCKRGVG